MTEHQSMNTVIHAAIRRDLGRFDQALSAFPAGSQSRADQLATAWENFTFQLHHHHSDEETIFWPALRSLGADEPIVADLASEHARMLEALDSAGEAMKAFKADPSAENAAAARTGVAALASTVGDHLDHEERDLEPFAVAQKGSAPMKAAAKSVRKAHQGNTGAFFAWLLDGADADAARGLRQEIPPPVVFVISRVAGRRYTRTVATVWA
jgi:hemerythrin-like domain-containing protein